jgi:hypothetical protein
LQARTIAVGNKGDAETATTQHIRSVLLRSCVSASWLMDTVNNNIDERQQSRLEMFNLFLWP